MDQAHRHPSWWSYFVVMALAAILAGGCWYFINVGVGKLDRATAPATAAPPAPPVAVTGESHKATHAPGYASVGGTKKPVADEKPPTLSDLFKSDLPSTMKITNENTIQGPSGDILDIKTQIYADFPARTKFVGFYIPRSPHTYDVCLGIVSSVRSTIEVAQQRVEVTGGYRGEQNSLQDLTFSGRVLLYHEEFLSIPQKAEIIKAYAAQGFDVNFRGFDYLGDQLIAWHRQHDRK